MPYGFGIGTPRTGTGTALHTNVHQGHMTRCKNMRMGQDHIPKSIARLLQSVDDLIGAQKQSGAAAGNRGPTDDCDKQLNALEANWSRMLSQEGRVSKQARDLACAKTWINAFIELKLALRIELMLATVREQAEAATSGAGTTEVSRDDTHRLVVTAGQAAFLLLIRSSNTACALHSISSSSKADKRKATEALTAMAQRGFMKAAADAARAISVFTASMRAEAGEPSQPASTSVITRHGHMWQFTGSAMAHLDGLGGTIADALCQCTWATALLALQHVRAAEGRGTDPKAEPLGILGSLVASGLLAAAAAAVLDCPCAAGLTHITLSRAACNAARAMTMLVAVQEKVAFHGGPEGRRLACGLMRAMRHEAVQRLQVALLDQLAAHAGMGAELGGGEEGGQEQGEQTQSQEAQGQADGWAGSSGAWWFAREEARRGELLGPRDGEEEPVAGSPTAGWLEGRHCDIVTATLWAWRTAEELQLQEEAGVPAAPLPVLRARLAARAAEALCRLCRGQGLRGAYAPAPQWELAMARALVQSLLPKTKYADSLPAATARSCLPHWLEAAGWAAALMSDAAAAAMGRLPSTWREGLPVHVLQGFAKEGSQAGTLDDVLTTTGILVEHEAYGVHTLPSAASQGVRRRLFCCGLAASLDHTLRLAYSAQDAGRADVASSLYRATQLTGRIACRGLAPLVPPEATADDVSSGDGGRNGEGGSGGFNAGGDGASTATGAGSSSIGWAGNSDGGTGQQAHRGGCSRPSAGGDLCGASGRVSEAGAGSGGTSGGGGAEPEAGDQLGLLLTLSKRAAMLTRALEAEAGAAGVSGQGQGDKERRQELMDMALDVLEALGALLMNLEREVRRRLQEVRSKGPEPGGDSAYAASHAPDAGCVDEAHEALALGARAASNLAATYARQLAAGVAGGTAAAGESSVRLAEGQATAVYTVLDCLLRWCRPPMLLPPAQLLACQPHRLLAAACALPAEDGDQKQRFGRNMAMLVVTLSAHKALGGRVRSWLAPRPSAAAAAAAAVCTSALGIKRSDGRSGNGDGDACAGCLAAPLRCAIWPALGQPFTAQALALLKLAAREVVGAEGDTTGCPGGGGDDGGAGEADGGFQEYAAAVYELVQKYLDDPEGMEAQEPPPPDGSHGATDLVGRDLGAGGNHPQPPQPRMAPTWPLPPPLVLPPGRDLALPRLRVCGNPRCGNFGCEGEWALPLKQCGGCRAVRYCGADCQRAHWREGHRVECKALAAGVASH